MKPVIRVAHDITCPWCWIAFSQVQELRQEFDVTFDWVGHELFPPDMAWPDPSPPVEHDPRRAPVPTRLELAYIASGVTPPPPKTRPSGMRSHNVLLALEWAKNDGCLDGLLEKLYTSYWLKGHVVNDLDVLVELSSGIASNPAKLRESVESEEFAMNIIPFDEPSYEAGVFNVPTFFVGSLKLAEQPTPVLRGAIKEWLEL